MATPFAGTLQPGEQRVTWDGAKRVGRLPDGAYDASVTATDGLTSASLLAPRVAVPDR